MKTNNIIISKKAKSAPIPYLILVGILLVTFACGSSRDTTHSEDLQDYNQLREMVENREFEVVNQWAMPIGGNMVNLIGNPNKIKFQGDSVHIHLPYFGIRYSGGGYGSEGGIKFNGIPEDISVEEDESERKIVVEFEGQYRNENLNFFMTLHSNGTANTSVNTSQRSVISYRGKIKIIPDESQEDR